MGVSLQDGKCARTFTTHAALDKQLIIVVPSEVNDKAMVQWNLPGFLFTTRIALVSCDVCVCFLTCLEHSQSRDAIASAKRAGDQ